MKMRQTFLKAILVLSIAFLWSCNKKKDPTPDPVIKKDTLDVDKKDTLPDTQPKGDYINGVFILNEGNFGKGNASVSFISQTGAASVKSKVYSKVNKKDKIGDVLQSGYRKDSLLFLVVNNSKKVICANAYTLKKKYEVSAYELNGKKDTVKLPRFFTVANGKGYLTEWVSYGSNGKVLEIDLKTGKVTKEIAVGKGAEDIEQYNGNLYVSNGSEKSISIINLSSFSTSKIDLAGKPSGIEIDKAGNLWAMFGGGSDKNWKPLNNGAIYKIDTKTNKVVNTFEIKANALGRIDLNKAKDKLYYAVGKKVFALSTSATSLPTNPIFTPSAKSVYGITVDPKTDNVYVSDSQGFTANGKIFRYKADGTAIDNFSTKGISPNGVVFN